ncbi:MAG: type II toxin-antitoxin system VapC family toxin [Pirellulales bacterium]|nr:type II toxin-antitoxin system VapC family toxin [Pirellulales bacterium]
MRLLIDTNRYKDAVARDFEVAERLQAAEEVWLSVITVGELLAGFAQGTRRERNEARLRQMIEMQGVGVLVPDFDTAQLYGQIIAHLRKQGMLIPTNDVWIAAQALQHGLLLDTRDQHFRRVPGVQLA